jgi:hypothetical protein
MGWIQKYDIDDEPLPMIAQIGSTEDLGPFDRAVERHKAGHEDQIELDTGELNG